MNRDISNVTHGIIADMRAIIKRKTCLYCNPAMSHGNNKIYKDKDAELYIVGEFLYLLKSNRNNADKIEINYCPICGKKL